MLRALVLKRVAIEFMESPGRTTYDMNVGRGVGVGRVKDGLPAGDGEAAAMDELVGLADGFWAVPGGRTRFEIRTLTSTRATTMRARLAVSHGDHILDGAAERLLEILPS